MECAPYVKVWRDIRNEPGLRRQTKRDDGATGWMFVSLMLIANDCDFPSNPKRGLLVKDGSKLDSVDFADAAGQKQEVADASLAVLVLWGWVVETPDGWFIPKYERRQESREAKRQREFRERHATPVVTTGVTNNVTSNGGCNADVTPCPGPGLGPGLGQKESTVPSPTDLSPGPVADANKSGGEPKPTKPKKVIQPDKIQLDSETWQWTGVTDTDRELWAKAFPGIDVDQQLARASDWVRADYQKRRKVRWHQFISNWFGVAQDKAGRGGSIQFQEAARMTPSERRISQLPDYGEG
jgi:hypothetical protein